MSPHGPQKKEKKNNHFFSLAFVKGTASLQSQSRFNTKSFNWVYKLTITYLPTYLPTYLIMLGLSHPNGHYLLHLQDPGI
jgi:hypothetical protein